MPPDQPFPMLSDILIRPIHPNDNLAMARIIRDSLTEFGANRPGTVYYDPTTDALFELFQQERSAYWVAESAKGILGGAGIFPTPGLPGDTCELVKMYLVPEARGRGLGKKMIETCFATAREMGYKNIYLETMPELEKAVKVYEKLGFEYLPGPLGNSGHFGCGKWMLKAIV